MEKSIAPELQELTVEEMLIVNGGEDYGDPPGNGLLNAIWGALENVFGNRPN